MKGNGTEEKGLEGRSFWHEVTTVHLLCRFSSLLYLVDCTEDDDALQVVIIEPDYLANHDAQELKKNAFLMRQYKTTCRFSR